MVYPHCLSNHSNYSLSSVEDWSVPKSHLSSQTQSFLLVKIQIHARTMRRSLFFLEEA